MDRSLLKKLQLYRTPAYATNALLDRERFQGTILEPGSALDDMLREIQARYPQALGRDKYDYVRDAATGYDFLTSTEQFDNIIANFPYDKNCVRFIRQGKRNARRKLAALLNTNFGASKETEPEVTDQDFPLARIYCFTERIHFIHDLDDLPAPRSSPRYDSAWYVWDRQHTGPVETIYLKQEDIMMEFSDAENERLEAIAQQINSDNCHGLQVGLAHGTMLREVQGSHARVGRGGTFERYIVERTTYSKPSAYERIYLSEAFGNDREENIRMLGIRFHHKAAVKLACAIKREAKALDLSLSEARCSLKAYHAAMEEAAGGTIITLARMNELLRCENAAQEAMAQNGTSEAGSVLSPSGANGDQRPVPPDELPRWPTGMGDKVPEHLPYSIRCARQFLQDPKIDRELSEQLAWNVSAALVREAIALLGWKKAEQLFTGLKDRAGANAHVGGQR